MFGGIQQIITRFIIYMWMYQFQAAVNIQKTILLPPTLMCMGGRGLLLQTNSPPWCGVGANDYFLLLQKNIPFNLKQTNKS